MPFLVFWRLRSHCAVSHNVQNAISWPLQSARSLDGGSKCHIGAFRDFAAIARCLRMLKMPFGGLEIARSLRGGSKCHIWPFRDMCHLT